MSDTALLGILVAGIGLLLYLVLCLKLHAFVALLLSSVFLGLCSGMAPVAVIGSITEGMGGTLGFVATVVGMGAIFGQILESSGGAESLSRYLIRRFGKQNAPYALAVSGFLVAIPVFLDVGFIILVPIVYALARDTRKSLLFYAIPLLAGLAVTHAFIPPTPGPIAVAELLDADLGWVVLFGFIIGVSVTFVAGPLFGRVISRRIYVPAPDAVEQSAPVDTRLPSFRQVLCIISLPLMLILANTVTGVWAKRHPNIAGSGVEFVQFIGHPFIALLIATLLAVYFMGVRRGFSRTELLQLSSKALAPAGLIILVTGAGGVLKQLLIDSEIGVMLAEKMSGLAAPPIVLAWLLAAIIRVTQGSATVAMITSAGLIAPLLATLSLSEPHKALVVIAIASGATILSHVNDSGFWLVGKYLGLSERQTLQSWTVMETIIAVLGGLLALLASFLV
ncbi:MAG: GntP family permease [Bacteroidales bacterium]|jgi:Gnt-I system low-affinity gluconate transporter|nr:GntP family permease [Bacteroidales bacterium]